MFKTKKILVATDMTPASETAVAFAADIAGTVDARVILVHAISPINLVDYGIFDDDTMIRATESRSESVETRLHGIATEVFPQHLAVEPRAVSGYPITSICSIAEDEDVDLIVMGTRGRNPFVSFLIGSVIHGVLSQSSRPLVSVPRSENPKERREILTILCPVNFTDVALRALEHAADLGAELGAEVLALHLVEPEELVKVHDVTRQLETWIPKKVRDKCQVRILVHRGNAAEEVVRYAKTEGVDLIVIGAEHKRFAGTTVLGMTTERVIRHATSPVLTVMTPREASAAKEKKLEPAGAGL